MADEHRLELGLLKAKLEGRATALKVVGVLGMGVPRLACLQPAAWLNQWPSSAHFH